MEYYEFDFVGIKPNKILYRMMHDSNPFICLKLIANKGIGSTAMGSSTLKTTYLPFIKLI